MNSASITLGSWRKRPGAVCTPREFIYGIVESCRERQGNHFLISHSKNDTRIVASVNLSTRLRHCTVTLGARPVAEAMSPSGVQRWDRRRQSLL